MKSLKHFLFASLALVLLLSCVGVGPANAQGLTGKFVLPCAAHWGKATLAPGEYRFTMDRPAGMLYVHSGRMTVGMVLPQSVDWTQTPNSALLITQSAGVNSISELRLSGSGVVLRYAPFRLTNHRVIQAADLSFLVPITFGD